MAPTYKTVIGEPESNEVKLETSHMLKNPRSCSTCKAFFCAECVENNDKCPVCAQQVNDMKIHRGLM